MESKLIEALVEDGKAGGPFCSFLDRTEQSQLVSNLRFWVKRRFSKVFVLYSHTAVLQYIDYSKI